MLDTIYILLLLVVMVGPAQIIVLKEEEEGETIHVTRLLQPTIASAVTVAPTILLFRKMMICVPINVAVAFPSPRVVIAYDLASVVPRFLLAQQARPR